MKAILLSIVCFLTSTVGHAQTTFGLHVRSWHDHGICTNGNNPGAYVQSSDGFVVGAYRNSCERTSAYLGYEFAKWEKFSLVALIVTGYFDPVTPAIFPTAAFPIFDTGADLRLSGGVWDGVTVVHFSIEWGFK